MPRRKVGFLGLELGLLGVEEEEEEERMKTPTPTRTWGGIFWGIFWGVSSFLVALEAWLFACFGIWLLLLLLS